MAGEAESFGSDKPLSAHEAGKFARRGKTNYHPDDAEVKSPRLTERQNEVLALAALRDPDNEAIAKELGVAKSTVDTHFEHIFKNLDVNSRASAVTWFHRRRDGLYRKQVTRLKAENEALEKENRRLKNENAGLKALLAQHGSSAASEPSTDPPV